MVQLAGNMCGPISEKTAMGVSGKSLKQPPEEMSSVASPGSFIEESIISGTSLGMFSATI